MRDEELDHQIAGHAGCLRIDHSTNRTGAGLDRVQCQQKPGEHAGYLTDMGSERAAQTRIVR